jgi:hypothetical protein
MAQGSSGVLATNYTNVTPADQAPVSIPGGRFVIVADGTTFPTACQVQGQCQNGSWVSIGGNIAAASISAGLDLPAGQYRLHAAAGAASAVSVALVRIPY